MERYRRVFSLKRFYTFLITICLAVACASVVSAQFGLPKIKIPKLPGQKQTKPKAQEKTGPAPEITAINPDSGPPGGGGEVVLTGKNLTADLRMRFQCGESNATTKRFTVQSAERASVVVTIPLDAREGTCGIELVRVPGAGPQGDEETPVSVPGTPEVYAVPDNGPKFTISSSGKLPISIDMLLLGEGEMNFMDMQMKMAQEMQSGFGKNKLKTGQIQLTGDTIKYVQEDKVVFSGTSATVKSVDQMTMMGKPVGIFRIVLTDGKIYNFGGSGQGQGTLDRAVKLIKQKLGK
jgi:hypothetical protein